MNESETEKFLNTPHMPYNVPEELVPDILDVLNRIPPGWGKWLSLDSGWYSIIVQLNKELTELDPDYEVHQVKEKFGSLRYYFGLSELPRSACCVEWSTENPPPPRSSWRSEDPRSQEYLDEYAVWADAHERHHGNEKHQALYEAQEPLREARHELYLQMQKLVDEAERVSIFTCELCGLSGSMFIRGDWLKTLCHSCANELGFHSIDEEN